MFFAARAATWETRFPEDGPAYARAVTDAGVPAGVFALDVGCGTGRALDPLAAAVGRAGRALGVDVTPEMLAEGRARGRRGLVLADGHDLPLPDACVDVVFAAGYVNHTPDPAMALRELGRVSRPGGRLVVFHPIGRAALAAKRGTVPRDDDLLAPRRLAGVLGTSGWVLGHVDDAKDRYLALATRG